MTLKVTNIAKRLKHHDRFCKVHTCEAFCSCGRDKALEELAALIENQRPDATQPALLPTPKPAQEPSHAQP